ncbi:hypothetical protein PAN31117_03139 [Pandoraea anapnoica]|uniref:Uncharacterized protein n=1 Tax=Pandoraea anapnoica TaxID=2508301 RepID=A0A5E5A8P0_9BURK|nr:hypothetical protein [Pandoraea anapnoica]VVE68905.1 hypothetical protein PAN31117_03139 [Pandoraea anapnoica]
MFQRLIVDPVNAVFLRYNQWTIYHKCAAWACHLSALVGAIVAKLVFDV